MRTLYCPTAETIAISWLLHASATQSRAALVVGPAGCGKTTAIRGLLQSLSAADPNLGDKGSTNCHEFKLPRSSSHMHHIETILNSQTNVHAMQRHVRGWFSHKKMAGVRRPVGEGALIAFVDDISMPAPETSGAQPALEVLRQILVWLPYSFDTHISGPSAP
jgi:MoxR-like ATPase